MNRNAIIGICVAFCAIAVGAGWLVAGTSKSPIAAIAVQTPEAQATGGPTASTTSQTAAPSSGAAALPTSGPTRAPAQPTSQPTLAATAAPTAPAATAAPTAATIEASYVEYTIQKGDLLNNIAKQYNVTTKDIIAINQIPNPDSLIVGQVIRIPKK